MGRHSAPEDESVSTAPSAIALADPAADSVLDAAFLDSVVAGRHSVGLAESGTTSAPGEIAEHDTVDLRPVAPRPSTPRREGGTHADLRLLRHDAALRARCAAAVVAPFLIYTVVLLVVGQLGSYLLYVWAPAVTAGVGFGLLLDSAHRRLAAPSPEPTGEPTVEPIAEATTTSE